MKLYYLIQSHGSRHTRHCKIRFLCFRRFYVSSPSTFVAAARLISLFFFWRGWAACSACLLLITTMAARQPDGAAAANKRQLCRSRAPFLEHYRHCGVAAVVYRRGQIYSTFRTCSARQQTRLANKAKQAIKKCILWARELLGTKELAIRLGG